MATKVMLIDDDQEFLDILAERLVIRGFEVTKAISAKKALERLPQSEFDVIILDLQMPEMNGLQAIERLSEMVPDQPIILLTAHATVSKGVQAMKLGAADVLEKPVDIRELMERIEIAAKKKHITTVPGKGINQFFKRFFP